MSQPLNESLTQSRLKELLEYSPETGFFFWLNPPSNVVKKGQRAGCEGLQEYWVIRVDGFLYKAGRLAWFYTHGEWPNEIDHKNRNKRDDRLDNLRDATSTENKANRSARNELNVKGVRLHHGRYAVNIKIDYKTIHIGVFNTIEEASAAYKKAAIEAYGEFACAE